ncbi:MAG: ABC transporter permease subunit [Myxococcales bacterium]|nr:ABC transporter permease subunit [Myxococcales bacterium]
MIRRVWHIARREWLEQRRQPAMLTVIATLYTLVTFLSVLVLAALDWMVQMVQEFERPDTIVIAQMLQAVEGPEEIVAIGESTVTLFTFLMFTQFVGFGAVLSGHAVLHDRQCGTLTFLLLAPVRRSELLLGKVLGAISWATLLYLLVFACGASLASSFDVARAHPQWLPVSVGWWVTFALGALAWALFTGSVCTVISAFARDVRTAQQAVWFVVFFATLGSGALLVGALEAGLAMQLTIVALALCGAGSTLGVGSLIVGRTVDR